MNHQPFFSIVIPTCNREALLKQCLQALKRQGFLDFEVLVVDNGEMDSHKDLESTILSILDNAFVMHNEEKGAAHARNMGKTYAKGKYVIFLDDDEFFEKDYLHSLHHYIQSSADNCKVIKTGTLFENSDGNYIKEGQFRSDASLLQQIWVYGASMSDYCFESRSLAAFSFDATAVVIQDFLFLNQVLNKNEGRFTPIFGVKIPFHQDRISYKKFDSAFIYLSVELSIIRSAYSLNKGTINLKLAFNKSLKTIFAYGKRIIKSGKLGQIVKLVFTSLSTLIKLIRIAIQ